MSLAVLQQAALLSSQRAAAAAAAAAATAQSQTAEAPGGDTSHQDTASHPNNNNPTNNNETMTNPASATTNSAAAGASTPGQIVVTEQDVLCGRGGETNHHPGNVAYRTLVKTHQPLYIKAKRRDKPKIARAIVDTIMLQYGGRFLKRATSEDGDLPEPPASSASQQQQQWVEISVQKAREKTSQALRENAPNLRNKEQEEILMAERQKQIRTDQRIEHQLAEEAKREAVFQKIMEHQLVAQQQDKQRAAAAAAAEASAAAVVLKAAAAQAQKVEHDGRSSLLGATMATQQHQHPHQQHHHHPAPYILKSHAPAPAQQGHTKSNLAQSVPASLASKQDVGSNRLRDFLGTNVGHGHGNSSDVTLPNGSGDDRLRCTTDFLPGVLHHSSTNGGSSATRSYLFDGTGKRPTGSAGTLPGVHQSHCSSTSEADAHATAVANLIRANERSARYPSTSAGDSEAAGPASNSTLSHLFTHTRADPSSNLRDTSPVKALLYEHLYGRLAGSSSSGTVSTTNTTAVVPQHPFYHNHHLHHQPHRHYNHEPETIAPDREGKGPWANGAMKDTLARSQIAHELARSSTTGATGTVFEPTKTSHPYNLYDRSTNAAALARTRSASEHLVLSEEITRKASSSDKYLPSRAMTSSDARRIAHQDDSNAAAYPKDVAGTTGSVDLRPRDRSTNTTGPTTHASDLSNPANRMKGDEAIAAAAFLQLFNAGSRSGSRTHGQDNDAKCKTNAAATSSPKMTGSSAPSSSTNSTTVAPISPTSDSSRNTTSSGGLSCASGDEGVSASAPARGVGPRLKRFKRRLEEESEVVQGSPQKLMRQQEQHPPHLPFNVSQ